jgi:hypothetical protein
VFEKEKTQSVVNNFEMLIVVQFVGFGKVEHVMSSKFIICVGVLSCCLVFCVFQARFYKASLSLVMPRRHTNCDVAWLP